jgi:hypothetical protein
MTKLLEKDAKALTQFSRIEEKTLTLVLTMPMPDMEKPFSIYYDASDQGLGCVLMQDGHVLAYASRQLRNTRREVPDP